MARQAPGTTGQMSSLSAATRTLSTRIAIAVLLVIAVDGALTWIAIDRAAEAVTDIETRDGLVIIDDSDTGMRNTLLIERAADGADNRIRLGDYKWIPAVLIGVVASVLTSRAEPRLRRSLVMAAAIAISVWLAPRVLYSSELKVLDQVFG